MYFFHYDRYDVIIILIFVICRLQEGSILNDKFSYHSETKQNEVCDNPRNIKPITIHQFQQKKVSCVSSGSIYA